VVGIIKKRKNALPASVLPLFRPSNQKILLQRYRVGKKKQEKNRIKFKKIFPIFGAKN